MYADRILPNAKVQNSDLRERADKLISDNNFYEILLVGSDKNITEGSRSNVFFIKGETLYSAPDDKILEGITRKKVLQICRTNDIPVVETTIPATSLNQYDAAFLTGTSPKVLPISSIDRVAYKTNHPLLLRIIQEYNQLVENDLTERRASGNYQ
jgi:branched-chain amino acid aminotransferase